MSSNDRHHRSMPNEDGDDEDIATVYSKEYSFMAAMFNRRASAASSASTIPSLPPPTGVGNHMKIVGIDQNPAPLPAYAIEPPRDAQKATSRIIQPLDMDLEWTTYRTATNPNLLIPPTPKKVQQTETNPPESAKSHQPASPPSVTTAQSMGDSAAPLVKQHGAYNQRWMIVLLLGGIFLTAALLAVGLSVLHQQAQKQSQASAVDSSATIAPIDLLNNLPEKDDKVDEPATDGKKNPKKSPTGDNATNATQASKTKKGPAPTSPPVRSVSTTPKLPTGAKIEFVTGYNDTNADQAATPQNGPAPTSLPVRTILPTPDLHTEATIEFAKPMYITRRVVVALIGNTPYDKEQETNLWDQLTAMDSSTVDFVVHLGNLRDSDGQRKCKLDDIESASEVLQQSPVPVFVLLGDNDWQNCDNDMEALSSWEETFVSFQQQYWSTRSGEFVTVTYPIAPRPTSFAMEYNDILWVGLTLPSSSDMESADDWSNRLQDEYNWTESVVQDYQRRMQPHTGRVVLMGHANPNDGNHPVFFDQLASFVSFQLQNRLPIAYVNGNGESWSFVSGFFNQPAFAHLVVPTSQSSLPTMTITATGEIVDVSEAFAYASPDESNDDFTIVGAEQSGTDDDQSDDAL